jgi:hypothetical protein
MPVPVATTEREAAELGLTVRFCGCVVMLGSVCEEATRLKKSAKKRATMIFIMRGLHEWHVAGNGILDCMLLRWYDNRAR